MSHISQRLVYEHFSRNSLLSLQFHPSEFQLPWQEDRILLVVHLHALS